jgi:hypothetical protein
MSILDEPADPVGHLPYRMALAGGWIDQPFVSRLNPEPPGSMVVVSLEPDFRFMDRCGMATSTREVAKRIWSGQLPERPAAALVRELYAAENEGKAAPSGSQDMAGLIYPGVSRLDYHIDFEGGYFPVHVESCTDSSVARWLGAIIHMVPVAPRPAGYSPLGEMNLDVEWIRRLGKCGQACYNSIVARDSEMLGESMNECMECWESILPQTVRHPVISLDLRAILRQYQRRYAGAMYSGCGGGYLFVVSEEPVPGAFTARVRTGLNG